MNILLICAFLFCPQAHADNPDQKFLDSLRSDGITYSDSRDIILYAHGVCMEMQQGVNYNSVVKNILKDFPLPQTVAEHLAADSILAYCPDYWGKVLQSRLNEGGVQ